MTDSRSLSSAIVGCLVADAAALGLHWLYNRDALDQALERSGREPDEAAFFPITSEPYKDQAGYFAHAGKSTGDFSQYGQAVLFWLECRLVDELHTPAAWQSAFLARFGPGGSFSGFADRPTRNTVNLLLNKPDEPMDKAFISSSTEDDQNPVLNSILAAVACKETARPMAHTTHRFDVALQYLDAIQTGLNKALSVEVKDASEVIATITPLLPADARATLASLNGCGTDREAIAACTSTACHLPSSAPTALHILRTTHSFEEAITLNIRLGGDSCGRALMIGPIAGALYGIDGMPAHWLMSLNENQRVARVLAAL